MELGRPALGLRGVNSLWQNARGPVLPVGARPAMHPARTTPLRSVLRCVSVETHAAQFSRWGLDRRCIPAEPPSHRENWPLSALTRVSPQAVSASLRSGEVGPEWARNPPIRAVPWRETGSSRRLPLPVAHLASAEVAPAAFGAETGCLNGLLEEPACRKRCGRRRFGRPSIQEPAMEGDFRLPRLRVDPVRTRRPPFSAFLGEWPALRASGGSPPRRP